MATYWNGSAPKCDAGNDHPLNGVFYDVHFPNYHQWMILCPNCFIAQRLSDDMLGIGRGQKYRKQDNGRWLKVAG